MRRSDHPRLNDTVIARAALCGGTHGNERTGVTAVARRRLLESPDGGLNPAAGLPVPRVPRSFTLDAIITNPRAVDLNRRYVDYDLNRCFATRDLAETERAGYEWQRAQVLNAMLGPKGSADPNCQFVIDLHTTTANLGPTVIIREDEMLARIIAAAVQRDIPELRIMSYYVSGDARREASENAPSTPPPVGGGPGSANAAGDYPYLAEITPHGIEVEVGPVPQGVVRADVLIWTERIINGIVAALDEWNQDREMDIPSEITVYRYVGDSDFPRDATGEIAGMIHPNRQDRDFEPLMPGDPLYLAFDGTVIPYDGPAGAIPLFINEAAYYEKRAALTLAQSFTIPVIAG
jgi:succinylglutamate desuccinylase